MTYCTTQDLIDRFGETELVQLTDRNGDGAIDQEVVDRAITDAAGEIDGYLASRYRVPLDTVPVVVRKVACNLAYYSLHARIGVVPETVKTLHEDAVRLLRAISRGEASLGVSESGAKARPADGAVMQSDGRTFGRDDKSFL